MSEIQLNSSNPFDSLDTIERELLSENKLETILVEYDLDDYNAEHKAFKNHLLVWHKQYKMNLVDNPKHENCVRVKIQEFLTCVESKSWGLNFELLMNYESPYSFDCYFKTGKYEHLVSDLKFQTNSFHPPRKNTANDHADNFLTLREDQLPDYFDNDLPLIIIIKDVDYSLANNRNVLNFARTYPWPKKKMECKSERKLYLIDTKTLKEMYRTDGTIPLIVPKKDRGLHNGDWNGETIGFASDYFPSYTLGRTGK